MRRDYLLISVLFYTELLACAGSFYIIPPLARGQGMIVGQSDLPLIALGRLAGFYAMTTNIFYVKSVQGDTTDERICSRCVS